jgi:hypothetical protein
MRWVACVALAGCGLDPARVAPVRVFAPDGAHVVAGDRFAAVIAPATEPAALEGADLVVWTGIPDWNARDWAAFDARSTLPAAAVLGREGKPAALAAVFPGMGPDAGRRNPSPWSSFDVVVGATTWRWVLVDPHRDALGRRWADECYWLPRVVDGGFDHLVMVTTAGDGLDELLAIVDGHGGAMKLVAVLGSGDGFALPGGLFGEAHAGSGVWKIELDDQGMTLDGDGVGERWTRLGGWEAWEP